MYPTLLAGFRNSSRIFDPNSSFLSNRWLYVVLDGKSLQEFPINADVPQGSNFGSTLFLLYFNDLSNDFTCVIAM